MKKIIITIALAIICVSLLQSCKKESLTNNENNKLIEKNNSANSDEIMSAEELRIYLCDALISFNESVRPCFEESNSFESFCKELGVDLDNVSQEAKGLLLISYECLEKNYSDEVIYSNYNGYGMMQAFLFTIENFNSDGAEFFGITSTHSGTKAAPCPH